MGFPGVVDSLFDRLKDIANKFVDYFPDMLIALIVIIIFHFLSRTVRRSIFKVTSRFSDNEPVNRILASIVGIVVWLCGFFLALTILNLNKTVQSLLAGAGILGLALGFAFQDMAANFVAGVVIAIRKPFTINHVIKVQNTTGVVNRMDLRTTTVRTFDGQEIYIPNKTLFTEMVTNFTREGSFRIDVPCGIGYAHNLDEVESVLMTAFLPFEMRDNGRPLNILFQSFGDSAVQVVVQFWVKDPGYLNAGLARHEAIKLIHRTLRTHKIDIPYPTRTVVNPTAGH